jgi:uncharacterized Zn-finger protein
MTLLDQTVILKAPLDCDVRKIGFILIDDEDQSQEAPMEIDYDISSGTAEKERKSINKNQCTQCSRVLANPSNLKRHIRSFHIEKEKFECKICNLTFKNRHSLSSHLQVHTDKKFNCDTCGVIKTTKYQLSQHMKTHEELDSTIEEDIFDLI